MDRPPTIVRLPQSVKETLVDCIRKTGLSPEAFYGENVSFCYRDRRTGRPTFKPETVGNRSDYEYDLGGYSVWFTASDHVQPQFVVVVSPHSFTEFKFNMSKLAPGCPLERNWQPTGRWAGLADVGGAFADWARRMAEVCNKEFADCYPVWEELVRMSMDRDIPLGKFPPADWALERFTEPEKNKVRSQLAGIRALIQEKCQLGEQSISELAARIEYLSGRLDELSRFDWYQVLVSLLVSFLAGLALLPEVKSAVLDGVRQLLSHAPRLISGG